jgi:hypothetical protein
MRLSSAAEIHGEDGHMETAGLKVWSWFGRDQASREDLQFVIAVGSRKELQQASVRLSLPSPKGAGRVLSSDPAYSLATANPGRLLWINLGDQPLGKSRPPLHWSSEEDLHQMRAAAAKRG